MIQVGLPGTKKRNAISEIGVDKKQTQASNSKLGNHRTIRRINSNYKMVTRCRVKRQVKIKVSVDSMSTAAVAVSSSTSKTTTKVAGVRIVVAGDHGTGKSSLINAAAAEFFPTKVPPVLPPTMLPDNIFRERVPVTVIDTSSSLENRGKLDDELQRADAVVLTYSCDDLMSISHLSDFWLPKLRRLEVKVPVIVVGCKVDLKNEQARNYDYVISCLMGEFREIETRIECSAYKHIQIPEVFRYSQKSVLHPIAPLYVRETETLKPRFVGALRRIFILCDKDRDGALSDRELNDFQVKCFNAPLEPSEIVVIKRDVQAKLPDGVNENGLTFRGFYFLHELFIEKGRLETTWTVLRKFGYTNDLSLSVDQLLPSIKRTPDQSVELTSKALKYLRWVFFLFDRDSDGVLNEHELDNFFCTASESRWSEAPYANAAKSNVMGGLSRDGFLAQWALMTHQNPVLSMKNLIYLGYAGDPSSAVRVTRSRLVDRKKQHSHRNVLQCFVFGPKDAGKSSLLQSFVGSPFSETYTPTTEERCAVNIVNQPDGTKKTLILREIPEDTIEKLLIHKDSLAACDIAVFVYDSSDKSSWLRATELLVQVASHGESTGYEVPCLIVAAKDDLEPYPTAIQDSTKVSQDMGVEAPIHISTKLGDFNDVFRRIVRAAEAGKTRKQNHRLINRYLMVVSVVAALTTVGAAYRVYATRKNA